MYAKVEHIDIPCGKRTICVSDIHGSLDLFELLLRKVNYGRDDILILLGDIYTKGKQNHDTLKYIMSLARNRNVHVVRGNCDWIEEYLSDGEKDWLYSLPHILESRDYIFVHGGLTSNNLYEQDDYAYMKNDAFMEKGMSFDKYIITGHWPTFNYSHKIPCCNPIVSEEKRIVSIDGGNILKACGQLNAFFIHNNRFFFDSADNLPVYKVEKAQAEKGGNLNITWIDRFVEKLQDGKEFSLYRHLHTGQEVFLPNSTVWTDDEGNQCECDYGSDYYLPLNIGDTVSVVKSFQNKIYAKKNGIAGWIENL
ncbi:MAG: metallophosphoesterase [Eubacteriales bacterium]